LYLKPNVLIIGVLIVAVIALVLIKTANHQEEKPAFQTSNEVSKPDPQGKSIEDLPMLIDLGRGTCIPCIKMKPILDEIAVEYKGRAIVKVIDLRYEPQEARRYGIRLIPTQIFYDATGKEVYRHEGFMDKLSIEQKLKEIGVK